VLTLVLSALAVSIKAPFLLLCTRLLACTLGATCMYISSQAQKKGLLVIMFIREALVDMSIPCFAPQADTLLGAATFC